MDLDDLLDTPGDREPLLTIGEGHAVLRLLQPVADEGGEDAEAADELIMRLARRLPEPPT
ncbi:hypothetical protein ABZ070_10205 [Streptomyces sp. NPDC006283]|uniref:hypothetical protein n=1 Tax=Streptomyces sp. NPDC006283 TaxID=3156741 RepID=UPI0033A81537